MALLLVCTALLLFERGPFSQTRRPNSLVVGIPLPSSFVEFAGFLPHRGWLLVGFELPRAASGRERRAALTAAAPRRPLRVAKEGCGGQQSFKRCQAATCAALHCIVQHHTMPWVLSTLQLLLEGTNRSLSVESRPRWLLLTG